MKMKYPIRCLLVSAAMAAPATGRTADFVTNRVTFSGRFGYNISARFKGNAATLPTPATARNTPRGDRYNYDDGYVLTDISGNYGGQTWYWGYDHSGSQISGNNVLLSRSTPSGDFSSGSFDSDPSYGFEATYNRYLGAKGRFRFGLEAAANFSNLSLHDSGTTVGNVRRVTDAYPFTPGTTPPAATPSNPYQGSYEGPGFAIGDVPSGSTTALVPGGFSIAGRREFDADIWGARLGPYVDFPFADNFNVWVSAGVAIGWINGDASWSETVTLPGANGIHSSGNGSHDEFLWGGYVGANVSWDFYKQWSLVAGVQYQTLDDYDHDFGARKVEVDLSNSWFFTVGLSWRF
jgi:hypothetical protein